MNQIPSEPRLLAKLRADRLLCHRQGTTQLDLKVTSNNCSLEVTNAIIRYY